ncbi:hypothetical protein ACIQUT_05785, partial [Streptomyces sp. NPDC090445]
MSLNNLARMATTQDALIAYAAAERDLAVHLDAARYIAVQRAGLEIARADANSGLRTLISIAGCRTSDTQVDLAAFHARQSLRLYIQADDSHVSQVSTLWRDTAGSEPPPWLMLPQDALDLAVEWINRPSWAASRAFWDDHAEDLRSPETALALEELALVSEAAEEHLRIACKAEDTDPDDAFRPYITGELLNTWAGLSTWEESETFLTDHAAALLHDQALTLLASDLETAQSAVHFALSTLARADGIPTAFRYVEDRPAVHERLRQVMADPGLDPDLLHALALLERFVYQDHFTGTAHLALASALAGSPPAPVTWPPAEPADRDRVISEIATLIGRHPQHAPALSSLIQQILAAAADGAVDPPDRTAPA